MGSVILFSSVLLAQSAILLVQPDVGEECTGKVRKGPEWEGLAAIGEEVMRTTGPERLERIYELLGRMRGE